MVNKTSLPDWINKAKTKLRKDVQSWYEKTSETNFPLKQWYHSPQNTTLRVNPRENRAGLGTSMFQISLKVIFSGKLVLP
jgi:hypothetical protein